MSGTDLCADFAGAGALLGCNLLCGPEHWDGALGDPEWPLVDVRKGRMRRDYGLVEAIFEKSEDVWSCLNVSLQFHRLASDSVDMVPPKIAGAYGEIGRVTRFADVAVALDRLGAKCELIADKDRSQYDRYWCKQSGVIIVVQGAQAVEPGVVWSAGLAVDGTIWSGAQ